MKRIALVHPRYGLEISGGSETYARKIAEHLANRYEVEVLTTKAVDSATWKDWYVRDVETIHGVTVRRFSVQQMRARDFQAFDEAYLAELAQGRQNLVTEKEWFEKHGPYAPDCIRYLRHYRDTYAAILFLSDANYLTYAGMPLAGNRAVFIPMAQNTSFFQFSSLESLYQRPGVRVPVGGGAPAGAPPVPTDRTHSLRRDGAGDGCATPDRPRYIPAAVRLEDEYLLYVGQVDEKKECPMLMRYFMEFQRRTNSRLKLVLAGKKICRIPEHPDILALGFLPENEKFSAIAGAKAVVIPSRQMGVSMTLLESMAMSVPVLVNGRQPGFAGTLQKEQRRFVLSELF